MKKEIALTIGGSDPSTGAGIQADLKSFSLLGTYGTAVITCLTAQNTKKVYSIFPVPINVIQKQIDCIFEEFNVNSVKTGMLFNGEIIDCVLENIARYKLKPIVDPIMISTSGNSLIQKDYIKTLKNKLLPKTYILTANLIEAEKLSGIKISTKIDIKKACEKIHSLGPKYILIKGGHFKGVDAIDMLFDGKIFKEFSLPKLKVKNIHGTGCSLSALITGFIAKKFSPFEAIQKSKLILWGMIKKSYNFSGYSNILDFSYQMIPPNFKNESEFYIWFELKNTIEKSLLILPKFFIPEVGINFGYSSKNPKSINDICAINGRIISSDNKPKICGKIEFGASKHIASIILAANSFDNSIRSSMNIRYSDEIINFCKKPNLVLGTFSRENEPKNAKSSMDWGTKQAISDKNRIPNLIFDKGSIGKEPMIRILGKNPTDVYNKLMILSKNFNKIR